MGYLDGPLPKRAQTDATTVAGAPPPNRPSFTKMPRNGDDLQGLADSLQYAFGRVNAIQPYRYDNPTTGGDYNEHGDTVGLASDLENTQQLREVLIHEFGHKAEHETDGRHNLQEQSFLTDPKGPYEDWNITGRNSEAFADQVMRSWLNETGSHPSGQTGYTSLQKYITPPRKQFIDSLIGDRLSKIPPTVKDYFAR